MTKFASGVVVYRHDTLFTQLLETSGKFGATSVSYITRVSISETSRTTASGEVRSSFCSLAIFTPPPCPSIAGKP